ncbi:MAG: hypothetical protein Q9P14_04645 [candidate division KSB1 bacterium]|nr:hypothetical protein [candidate division KSB1 bacterium]
MRGSIPGWQIRTRPVQSGEAPRPEQPAGAVYFDFELEAGDTQTLDFIMPYRPVAKTSPDLPKLRTLRFEARMQAAVAFWERQVSRGMQIHLPESKVVNAFKTNLIYDLMALDEVDGHAVQTVNLLHYHAFWLRDASFIVRMYNLTGYSDLAEKMPGVFSALAAAGRQFCVAGRSVRWLGADPVGLWPAL